MLYTVYTPLFGLVWYLHRSRQPSFIYILSSPSLPSVFCNINLPLLFTSINNLPLLECHPLHFQLTFSFDIISLMSCLESHVYKEVIVNMFSIYITYFICFPHKFLKSCKYSFLSMVVSESSYILWQIPNMNVTCIYLGLSIMNY